MRELIQQAISEFSRRNDKEFPTNFIIYRDGVGDAQRN
jgi:hypothetical protein